MQEAIKDSKKDVASKVQSLQEGIKNSRKKLEEKKKEYFKVKAEVLDAKGKRVYQFGLGQTILNICLPSSYVVNTLIMIQIGPSTLNSCSDMSVFSWLYSQNFVTQAYTVIGKGKTKMSLQ